MEAVLKQLLLFQPQLDNSEKHLLYASLYMMSLAHPNYELALPDLPAMPECIVSLALVDVLRHRLKLELLNGQLFRLQKILDYVFLFMQCHHRSEPLPRPPKDIVEQLLCDAYVLAPSSELLDQFLKTLQTTRNMSSKIATQ